LLELEGADVASTQPAQAALVISMAIIAMAVLSFTRPSPTIFPGFTHPNNVLGRMITPSTHSNAAVGRCSAISSRPGSMPVVVGNDGNILFEATLPASAIFILSQCVILT
jgi:hypothetical protein